MSDIIIEIKSLTRRFGAFTAVDALTLSVNAGERSPPGLDSASLAWG